MRAGTVTIFYTFLSAPSIMTDTKDMYKYLRINRMKRMHLKSFMLDVVIDIGKNSVY